LAVIARRSTSWARVSDLSRRAGHKKKVGQEGGSKNYILVIKEWKWMPEDG
jgi:hypothetical protein